MTISDDTYVADLIRLAGGDNVYGREADALPDDPPGGGAGEGCPKSTFFSSEPYPFAEEKHGALVDQLFGQETRRLFVDGDDYCWHGARTLEGLEAARILRGFSES